MTDKQFALFGWKIPGLSSAINSSVYFLCRSWKRDFGELETKALITITPTGGPVVAEGDHIVRATIISTQTNNTQHPHKCTETPADSTSFVSTVSQRGDLQANQ